MILKCSRLSENCTYCKQYSSARLCKSSRSFLKCSWHTLNSSQIYCGGYISSGLGIFHYNFSAGGRKPSWKIFWLRNWLIISTIFFVFTGSLYCNMIIISKGSSRTDLGRRQLAFSRSVKRTHSSCHSEFTAYVGMFESYYLCCYINRGDWWVNLLTNIGRTYDGNRHIFNLNAIAVMNVFSKWYLIRIWTSILHQSLRQSFWLTVQILYICINT